MSTKNLSRKEELQKELAAIEAEEQKATKMAHLNYVKRRDSLISEGLIAFKQIHNRMSEFKVDLMSAGAALREEMWKLNDVEAKDQKRFSITNEQGTGKLVFEYSERMMFDETADAGIELLQTVLKDKFESRNKTMYQVINKLLTRTRTGDYDPKMLIQLRGFEKQIDDPRFSKAIKILTDAQKVHKTSNYVRAYVKNEQGQWKDISLQFSAL